MANGQVTPKAAVERFFADQGWAYEVPAPGLFQTLMGVDNALKAVTLRFDLETPGLLKLTATLPNRVAPEKSGTVSHLVCRLNWGLSEGAFELDMLHGALRYRISADYASDRALLPHHVARLVARTYEALSTHGDAIETVRRGASPVTVAASLKTVLE